MKEGDDVFIFWKKLKGVVGVELNKKWIF